MKRLVKLCCTVSLPSHQVCSSRRDVSEVAQPAYAQPDRFLRWDDFTNARILDGAKLAFPDVTLGERSRAIFTACGRRRLLTSSARPGRLMIPS
jgi:hypothetical protein